MIDLGQLTAKVVVDTAEGEKKMQDFGTAADRAEGKSGSLTGSLKKLALGFHMGDVVKKTAESIVGCVQKADELQAAFDTLQIQTGATDQEMAGLEETLKSIYANGYGESFQDVALSLAEVERQTGLTGEALQVATESAMVLQDAFGFDIQDSTQAAETMVKAFGLSAEEAYNLIAQGSQKGLDKNGNLLESIGAYSEYFEKMGFSADDMFNLFANGAQSGALDMEKMGGAVKEFGTRAKEGSDTTIEAYQMLGLNADDLQEKFAQGGESANTAFQEVVGALMDCDDEVVKNAAGVALFGSGWEDMGTDGVEALTKVNGECSATADNLNKMKEIKYDNLGKAFEGIRRQLESCFLIPLGELLLPKLNEFANYIQDKMPLIETTMKGILEGIGNAISFVTEHLNIIIPILGGAVAGFLAFQVISVLPALLAAVQGAIAMVTVVQGGLNAVMAANPIGAVCTAIGLLVAAGIALYMNWDIIKEKCDELFTKISTVWDNIKTAISTKIEEIKIAIATKVEEFKNAAISVFEGFLTGVTEKFIEIKDTVFTKITEVKDAIALKVADFKTAATDIFTSFLEGITEKFVLIKNTVDEKVGDVKKAITDKVSDFKKAGKEIFNGVWDGLKEIWKNISTWISNCMKEIEEALFFWKSSEDEMDDADGSHRTGLGTVPFDGYRAILHRGEMVLTQPEADRYRLGDSVANETTITQNFYGVREEKTAFEAYRQTKKTVRELGLA